MGKVNADIEGYNLDKTGKTIQKLLDKIYDLATTTELQQAVQDLKDEFGEKITGNNEDLINQKISQLIGSAPETLDTIAELSAALKNNPNIIDILNNSISDKADKIYVDKAQRIYEGSTINAMYNGALCVKLVKKPSSDEIVNGFRITVYFTNAINEDALKIVILGSDGTGYVDENGDILGLGTVRFGGISGSITGNADFSAKNIFLKNTQHDFVWRDGEWIHCGASNVPAKGSVVTDSIANGAITMDKLANDIATLFYEIDDSLSKTSTNPVQNQIVANAIDEIATEIEDISDLVNKLNNNSNVTIANGSITTEKMVDGAITNDKLGGDAVHTSNVIDGAITEEKLSEDVKNKISDIDTYTKSLSEEVCHLIKMLSELGVFDDKSLTIENVFGEDAILNQQDDLDYGYHYLPATTKAYSNIVTPGAPNEWGIEMGVTFNLNKSVNSGNSAIIYFDSETIEGRPLNEAISVVWQG